MSTDLRFIPDTAKTDTDIFFIQCSCYGARDRCFSGSRRLAEFALSIGFYVSASGIITFNKSGELREIFADLPLDRLLVETDSPFLAPVPLRGHRNEPANVRYVAEKLAQVKDVSFEEIAKITSENFYRLFRKASDKGRYEF